MNKKKDDKKDVRVVVRLGKDEVRKLAAITYYTDKSRSEAIRKAINLLYNVEKTKFY